MDFWQTRKRAAFFVTAIGAGLGAFGDGLAPAWADNSAGATTAKAPVKQDNPAAMTAKASASDDKPAAATAKTPGKKRAGKSSAPESAEEAKRAEARARFEEGEAKLAIGEYAAAAAAFRAANELIASPQALYKVAVALDKEGKAEDAVAAYGAFLQVAPAGDSFASKVADAQGRVAELKKNLPILVKVTTKPAAASVSVDGKGEVGTTPLDLKLPPGTHAFHVAADGYDAVDKQVVVAPGFDNLELTLSKSAPRPSLAAAPPPAPAVPPAEPGASPGDRHTAATGYVLLGLAGAGAAVGTIFGVRALNEKHDFNNGLRTSSQADDVERDALIADLAFGTALTLGITGLVLLFSRNDEPKTTAYAAPIEAKPSSLRVVPVIGAHHAAAAASFQF